MRQKIILTSSVVSILLFLGCLLTSCGVSKKVNTDYLYFNTGSDTVNTQQKETIIQPNDLLGIQVYSRTLNQEQAVIFNMPASTTGLPQGYQVNAAGNIDMPVIGTVKAASLTREELQNSLAEKLVNNVKNPSVIVRFLQFNVSVLGEVRAPGLQKFSVDRVTIIDALSSAGDLTEYGRRDDVTVIREEGGQRIYRSIDLRSKAVFQSPVYILQPNDIVYVKPNKIKLKTVNVDPEVQRKMGLFLTIFSVALTVTTLFISLLR